MCLQWYRKVSPALQCFADSTSKHFHPQQPELMTKDFPILALFFFPFLRFYRSTPSRKISQNPTPAGVIRGGNRITLLNDRKLDFKRVGGWQKKYGVNLTL